MFYYYTPSKRQSSWVFWGYRNGILAWNWLRSRVNTHISSTWWEEFRLSISVLHKLNTDALLQNMSPKFIFVFEILNPLTTNVPIILKPASWFAEQIRLVSMNFKNCSLKVSNELLKCNYVVLETYQASLCPVTTGVFELWNLYLQCSYLVTSWVTKLHVKGSQFKPSCGCWNLWSQPLIWILYTSDIQTRLLF